MKCHYERLTTIAFGYFIKDKQKAIAMDGDNYSVLIYLYGRIKSRTCGKFNDMYPDLPTVNMKKLVRIQNNFINYGSRLTEKPQLPNPITEKENNTINSFSLLSVQGILHSHAPFINSEK